MKFLTRQNGVSKNSENHQKSLTHVNSKNSDIKQLKHMMEVIDKFLTHAMNKSKNSDICQNCLCWFNINKKCLQQ